MAKKGGGASEINGFISVPSTKPKQAPVKKPAEPGRTTSKNAAATTIKRKPPSTTTTPATSTSEATQKKTTTAKRPAQTEPVKTAVKSKPAAAPASGSRVKPTPPVIKKPAEKKTRTAPPTATKPTAPVKRAQPSQVRASMASKSKQATVGQPKVTVESKKPSKTTRTASSSSKIIGRSGLSYTVDLSGPEKKSSVPEKMVQLSRQGTFVKDDEHPEPEAPSHAEDFEAYESDFEPDSTASELPVDIEKRAPPSPDQNSFNQNDIVNRLIQESQETESHEEYDYEDDFEDYESDFEEDTESGFTGTDDDESRVNMTPEPEAKNHKPFEEERKLDSGNYDLMLKQAGKVELIKQRQLNEIKEAVSRENYIYKERISVESTKSGDESQDDPFDNQMKVLDFKEACERSESRQAARAAQIRGQQLSSMIRLYVSDYSLLEMSPIPYDEFIKLFGRNDYKQVHSQTGEDVRSEETETDPIQKANKWTQFPVEYRKLEGSKSDLAVYFHDRSGCGGDDLPKVPLYPSYDVKKLEEFILNAGEVMLIILEEEFTDKSQMAPLVDDATGLMEFSDGYTQINPQNLHFLADRSITTIAFSPHNPNILVVCHDEKERKDSEQSFIDEYYDRCILSVWNVLRPAQPEYTLVSPCPVSCCCFDNVNTQLFVAGLKDGTLSLWDLREKIHFHSQSLPNVDVPFILRSPTYCTCSKDHSDEKHVSTVINVKSTGREFHEADRFSNGRIKSTELVSVSEDGKLLVWTVVNINEGSVNNDLCLAPWGKMKLALSASFNTFNSLPEGIAVYIECTCMSVNRADWPSVLVGTSASVVLNCSPYGVKAKIPRFGQIDTSNTVTCLDFHPEDPSLFLVATSDGITKLYSTNKDHPLISFVKRDVYCSAISLVKWSTIRAGMFVILDEQCSLQIWDLCKADLAPQHSAVVNIDNKCLDLSRNIKFPYMAFVNNKTTVRVHRFKKSLTPGDLKIFNSELKLLKTYASKFT